MPTNRTPVHRRSARQITPEAIDAWKRADYSALHSALGLHPFERSPLPIEITVLGVDEDTHDVDFRERLNQSVPKALKLQRQLLAIAGWPNCREEYEKNLHEAEEELVRCQERANNPPREQYCWIDKPEAIREALADAIEQLEYRRELLAGLDEVQEQWRPK
jgi:hypothetical protein